MKDGCKTPKIDLDVGVNAPNLDVDEKLKNLLKTIKPDFDIFDVDLNFDELLGQINGKSIKEIRENLKQILKSVMNMIQLIGRWWSKIFYLR